MLVEKKGLLIFCLLLSLFWFLATGDFADSTFKNLGVLQEILEGTYDDLLVGIQKDVGFLNDSQDEQDLANFQKVKAYYSACTNLDVINSNGPTPLYPYISKLLSSIDNSPDNKNNYFGPEYVSSLTDTLIELLQHGAENIIWLDVGITTYHPDRYTLSLSQVDLTLPYKENYNHPYIIEQFRDGLVSILTQVLGEDASNISSIRFQMMHESNLYALGPKYIESMVDRFIQFESRLANLTLSE